MNLKTILLIAIAYCLLPIAPSLAFEEFFGTHYGPPARHHVRHKRKAPRVKAYVRRDSSVEDGRRCLPNVITIYSTAHQSEGEALKAAKMLFRAAVQNEHGNKYMDPEVAADFRSRCNIAEVGDAWRDKLGADLFRCVIKARPCTRPFEEGQ